MLSTSAYIYRYNSIFSFILIQLRRATTRTFHVRDIACTKIYCSFPFRAVPRYIWNSRRPESEVIAKVSLANRAQVYRDTMLCSLPPVAWSLLSDVARYPACLNYPLSHRHAGLSVLDSPRVAIRRLLPARLPPLLPLRSSPFCLPLLPLSTCSPRECECPRNLSQFVVLLSRFGNSRPALLLQGRV